MNTMTQTNNNVAAPESKPAAKKILNVQNAVAAALLLGAAGAAWVMLAPMALGPVADSE